MLKSINYLIGGGGGHKPFFRTDDPKSVYFPCFFSEARNPLVTYIEKQQLKILNFLTDKLLQ